MPDFDFFDPEFQENTHNYFLRMQKECPFAHTNRPFDWYAVTREADVAELLRSWELWTDEGAPQVLCSEPEGDLIAKARDAIEMCPSQAIILLESL